VTDISKWLHHFFGLAFLNPEDVGDSFAEDLIPDMPSDNKVQDFADYVIIFFIIMFSLCLFLLLFCLVL
jgi:hypothetical protein